MFTGVAISATDDQAVGNLPLLITSGWVLLHIASKERASQTKTQFSSGGKPRWCIKKHNYWAADNVLEVNKTFWNQTTQLYSMCSNMPHSLLSAIWKQTTETYEHKANHCIGDYNDAISRSLTLENMRIADKQFECKFAGLFIDEIQIDATTQNVTQMDAAECYGWTLMWASWLIE